MSNGMVKRALKARGFVRSKAVILNAEGDPVGSTWTAAAAWVSRRTERPKKARTPKAAATKKPKAPRVRIDVAQTYRAPTRAERQADHRTKMDGKYGGKRPNARPVEVPANLSCNHPDYGCPPAEHARRKAERNA